MRTDTLRFAMRDQLSQTMVSSAPPHGMGLGGGQLGGPSEAV